MLYFSTLWVLPAEKVTKAEITEIRSLKVINSNVV